MSGSLKNLTNNKWDLKGLKKCNLNTHVRNMKNQREEFEIWTSRTSQSSKYLQHGKVILESWLQLDLYFVAVIGGPHWTSICKNYNEFKELKVDRLSKKDVLANQSKIANFTVHFDSRFHFGTVHFRFPGPSCFERKRHNLTSFWDPTWPFTLGTGDFR